jgi:AcrR family transcriptional regulator
LLYRQVQRTRLFLREALLALIEERGYDVHSIQDITERAMLGRITFYEHYTDKEELLLVTLDELISDLAQRIEPLTARQLVVEQQTVSVKIFEHVAVNRQLYRALLSERSAALVSARLRTLIASLLQRTVIVHLVEEATAPQPAGSARSRFFTRLDHLVATT